MKYFQQIKGWEVGNFIMTTPMLRAKAGRSEGGRVNVWFQSPHVHSLFKQCTFMNILNDRPSGKPWGTSKHSLKRRKWESDYECYCRLYVGEMSCIPKPYVDKGIVKTLDRKTDKKHIAIFHGCNGSHHISKKDIGPKLRSFIIRGIVERGGVPVILGNKTDYNWFWKNVDLSGCTSLLAATTLRESVSVIEQCDSFISNDTGLYHAAGALEKPGLVIWGNTDIRKNMSPCKLIQHAKIRKGIKQNVDKYLDTLFNHD